jgi:glycosyltransferase involved in cell wall biosynthesis
MGKPPGSKGKLVWCVPPVISGVSTVYRTAGEGLRRLGWDVLGVSAGADFSSTFDPRVVDEFYQVLSPGTTDLRQTAAEFVHWVEEQKVDVIFNWELMFCIMAAPALPARVRMVLRSNSITRRSYEVVTTQLKRTSMIVAETPRQYDDLTKDWGVPPEKCVIVPGGVDTETYTPGNIRDFQGKLRLAFLGRLAEEQKAVMLLPRIARQLVTDGVDFHLDIIGEGPDGDRLREAIGKAKLWDHVTMHGFLPLPEVIRALQQSHIFLFPTRYEAHSISLLETMSCGCVPVVSRIAGGTDAVVNQGVNGYVCQMGKVAAYAEAIASLATDRKRLEAFSIAARKTILDHHTIERDVQNYIDLFTTVMARPSVEYNPIPVSAIQLPKIHNPGVRRFVPQVVKSYVRTWAERFHRTV